MYPETDEELIDRIVLRGDHRAYAALVDRHKAQAMTLAFRILKHHEEAEEALQDAFVRAFQALPKFDRAARFATWFYRIVYNASLTRLAKLKQHESVFEKDVELGVDVSTTELADSAVLSAERRETVNKAIQQLPTHLAAVVTLFYVQELSFKEIVSVTGLPLGTIKTHLFRARAAIKQTLSTTMMDSEVNE